MLAAWAPPLTSGECQVWWADPGTLDDPYDPYARPGATGDHGTREPRTGGVGRPEDTATAALSLLDAPERARWRRRRGRDSRALYLTAHVLVRLLLGAHLRVPAAELAFRTDCVHCQDHRHGKPRLVAHGGPTGQAGPEGAGGWEFSLSHTPHRVAVAVSPGLPLGVDVERVREPAPATLARALSVPEHRALTARPEHHRAGDFTRYWARKEATLKATGDGLAVAPDRLTVSPPNAPAKLLSWTGPRAPGCGVHLVDLAPGAGYRACLAVLGGADGGPRVTEHDGTALLRASLP